MERNSSLFMAHKYGPNVHILNSAYVNGLRSRFGAPTTPQRDLPGLTRRIYEVVTPLAIDLGLPRVQANVNTRMRQFTERGVFRGQIIDPATKVVVINVLRAGSLPSQGGYEALIEVLPDGHTRLDHLMVARISDPITHAVTGAKISPDSKIDGDAAGSYLYMLDCAGATGSTTLTVLDRYHEKCGLQPAGVVLGHMVICPEYIRRVHKYYPTAIIISGSLDRGMSPPDVLECVPGERWDEESGLDNRGYLVGGVGDIGANLNGTTI